MTIKACHFAIFFLTMAVGCRERTPLGADKAGPAPLARDVGLTSGATPATVATYRNDAASSGVNGNESILTPANVNVQSFGKLRNLSVDGAIYAQPLFASGVAVVGSAAPQPHDLVFVATEHDTVYAVDSVSGQPVWTKSLLLPRSGFTVTPVPTAEVNVQDITPEIGVTGTPVIDPGSNTLYVVAKTKEVAGAEVHYVQRLHALDLRDGTERAGAPAVIADTTLANGVFRFNAGPAVAGTGAGAVGGIVTFNALLQHQRAALLLANGHIYCAWASHGDVGNYHGWILGFDAATLALTAVFNSTPNGTDGGIWMAGGKLETDAQGNLYAVTGNGTFDTNLDARGLPAASDYGDAVLRLAPDGTTAATATANGWGLHVADYFVPFNQALLAQGDLDFGSGGLAILPDALGSAQHPHLLLAGGKAAWIYVLDRDHLGGFHSAGDQVVQTITDQVWVIFATPTVFGNSVYYATGPGLAAGGFPAKALTFSGGLLGPHASAQTPDGFAWPGAAMSLSANGTADGILWATEKNSSELRAYRADDLTTELYASHIAPNGRDALPAYTKFAVPTVANGNVFIGAGANLTTYGLLAVVPTPTPTPIPTSTPVPNKVVTLDITGIVTRADVPVLVDHAALTINGGSATTSTNVGWYSVVFNQTVPASAQTLSFTVCGVKLGYGQHCVSPSVQIPANNKVTAPLNFTMPALRTAPPSGGTALANWVRALYIDVLGREASSTESQAALAALANHKTKTNVALDLLRGAENRGIQVRQDFRMILRRTASALDVSGWEALYQREPSDIQVKAVFYGLSEFYHDNGSTAATFIEALYQGILGRPSDAAGKAMWTAKVATLGRQAVALAFLTSAEYKTKGLAPAYYHRWLKRAPTAAEIAATLGLMNHGYPQDQIQAMILASTEDFEKAQYGN